MVRPLTAHAHTQGRGQMRFATALKNGSCHLVQIEAVGASSLKNLSFLIYYLNSCFLFRGNLTFHSITRQKNTPCVCGENFKINKIQIMASVFYENEITIPVLCHVLQHRKYNFKLHNWDTINYTVFSLGIKKKLLVSL